MLRGSWRSTLPVAAMLSSCGGTPTRVHPLAEPSARPPDAGSVLAEPAPLTPIEAANLPAVHVEDGFIRDASGRVMILRGMNIASANKVSPYFGFQQASDYARVRQEWGMNAVRFLITWAAVEPQEGVYDDAYLDRVAERMRWAREAGLSVILDMHQDLFGEGFGGDGAPRWTCDEAHYAAYQPRTPWFLGYFDPNVQACFEELWTDPRRIDEFAAAWTHVAMRLRSEAAILGFDVINEPSLGTAPQSDFERQQLMPFYERVVESVRKVAPHWLAFLEPSSARNLGVPTRLTAFPFPDVVYAPHCYDVQAEEGNGFDPSQRATIVDDIAALAKEAQNLHAALWIGEYGGNADQPSIVDYMDAEYDGAARASAGNAYWAYDRDNGYGVLRPDGSEKTLLTDVLARPYPERIAGTPIAYAYDEVTRTFALRWHSNPEIVAPTVISVPARAYPDGYHVSCGGCESTEPPGELVVSTPPEGDPAQVVITP